MMGGVKRGRERSGERWQGGEGAGGLFVLAHNCKVLRRTAIHCITLYLNTQRQILFLRLCLLYQPTTATHYKALQHTATHCNTLQHTATHCRISYSDVLVFSISPPLHRTASHRNTLQHTPTRYDTLQHTATHCNTLQHTATHCNTLHHTATHCNTLQHTATHCNTLQHILF